IRRMFEFLLRKASDRKLRLFACACCRCIWHLLQDKRIRRAVVVAERFADGQASNAELDNAGWAVWQAECKTPSKGQEELQKSARAPVHPAMLDNVRLRNCILQPATAVVEIINDETAFNPCALVRDIFIYFPHVESISDSLSSLHESTLVQLAKQI